MEEYYTDEIGQTFDLKEQGVDIIVKVDGVTDTSDGSTSTLPLDARYGKIEAYNMKKKLASVEQVSTALKSYNVDTVSELFLYASDTELVSLY